MHRLLGLIIDSKAEIYQPSNASLDTIGHALEIVSVVATSSVGKSLACFRVSIVTYSSAKCQFSLLAGIFPVG